MEKTLLNSEFAQQKSKSEFYALPWHVRQRMFADLDEENGPLLVLQCSDLPNDNPELTVAKVSKLADYWTNGEHIASKNYVVSFEGCLPILRGDLCDWNSWTLNSRHRLPLELHDMEVPVALASYRFREEHYDLFCSKLFLTAVTRFCEGNPRSFRFDAEVIGDRIFVEEAPLADALACASYLDSALSKLTNSSGKRQMFELLKCEMGNLNCLYYNPVAIAVPVAGAEVVEEKPTERRVESRTFEQALLSAFPGEIFPTEDYIDTFAGTFVITHSKVSICRGLRPKFRMETMELLARRQEGFGRNSLLVRWPECFFSNSVGLVTVLHTKGQLVEQPVVHKPVHPPSYKKHLDSVARTLRLLCKTMKSHAASGKSKFALVWIDERSTDPSPQKIQLFHRYEGQKQRSVTPTLLISEGMRTVIENLKPRELNQGVIA